MKFKAFKKNSKKKEENKKNILAQGLYFALVGKIDAEIISEDSYINHGEYPTHYTVVRKLEKPDTYTDVFEEVSYSFRDESSDNTILKMYSFQPNEEYTSFDNLKDIINAYEEILDDNKVKPGDNKVYARTRKID